MDSVRKYHQLALDCLNLAEAARDPAIRGQMLQMVELLGQIGRSGRRDGPVAPRGCVDRTEVLVAASIFA